MVQQTKRHGISKGPKKTMNIKCLFVLGMAMFWILSVPKAIAEPKAPDAVVQSAGLGLRSFLDKIPQNSLAQFGFDQTDSFDAAVLGAPFLVHTITPSALRQYQSGVTVTSLLTPTSLWYFPVLIADSPEPFWWWISSIISGKRYRWVIRMWRANGMPSASNGRNRKDITPYSLRFFRLISMCLLSLKKEPATLRFSSLPANKC